ncbi:MAG: SMC-Scp complex subunit ScpB [Ignavibacteria bacterium GWF2_33_9]|nr:MAG: SMC-Scp complex subunit ScpB [Ignavibacteria bacterium GWF2_33_9]
MENINFELLSSAEKKSIIEALIFAADFAINSDTLWQIVNHDSNPTRSITENDTQFEILAKANKENFQKEIREIVEEINHDLAESDRPYEIVEFAGGWQFSTRKEFGRIVHFYYKSKLSRRLSNAALEVLSIIAYRQPITKAEIEQIRGVNSNEVVNSLLEKSFVKIAGRKNVLGRPLLFEVTSDFLRAFGMNSLEDLPKMKDFEDLVREEFTKEEEDIFTLDVSDVEIEHIEAIVDDTEPEDSDTITKDTSNTKTDEE